MGIADATWIDESLVEKILRTANENESIKVTNLTVKPMTSIGASFSSDIYQVAVGFSTVVDDRETENKLSLVFKISPSSGPFKEFVIEGKLFEAEILALSVALPKMNELLRPLGTTLSPRMFHGHHEKPKYLVLEDLAAENYRLAVPEEPGLDLEHCSLVMRTIAKLHASSVALREMEPGIDKIYKYRRCRVGGPTTARPLYHNNVQSLAKVSANWPDLDPKISEKLWNFAETAYDLLCESSVAYEGEFNVLQHGDLWLTNMLFKYDEDGKPIDLKLVDFQYPEYGSPAVDLLFFLATSPSEDVRDNHRESLLREYYSVLTATMRKLGCTTIPPTFQEFEEDLQSRFWIETITILFQWPAIGLDLPDMETLNGMLTDMSSDQDSITVIPGMYSRLYKKMATKELEQLDSQGLLDA